MKETNKSRGLYQKSDLSKSGGAVSFPALPDMWCEMQRCYDNFNDNHINLFNIYTKNKYFNSLCDFPIEGA